MKRDVLAGPQTEAGVKALLNFTPSAAIASMLGVLTIFVDPEMLGKIFENLLEDNKDKGAFYTPKEIVRYTLDL